MVISNGAEWEQLDENLSIVVPKPRSKFEQYSANPYIQSPRAGNSPTPGDYRTDSFEIGKLSEVAKNPIMFSGRSGKTDLIVTQK